MARAAVPDSLLGPLLDTAAEVLRDLAPDVMPPALRPLAGFDRRGLANATARHQLRRAFDLDDGFRALVVARFVARPEVGAVLDRWSPEAAPEAAAEAASRDDLDLWTSALYAAMPDGAEFGLGVACGQDRHRRHDRARQDEARANALRLATAEEARRRAEEALVTVRAELARVEGELRDERRSRRDREAAVERRSDEATRALRDAEAALERARREGELAEVRARREAERARDAERRLREVRREAAPATRATPAPTVDPAAVADAARRARDLAASLEALVGRTHGGTSVPATLADPGPVRPARPTGPGRRASVPCPPGLVAEHPDAVEAMLRTPGVVLVVDGYNVSMRGWPDLPVARQRDQLVSALVRLHLRLRPAVVVVFDGAAVEGVTARRTPGVRVVFSAPGQEADPVVVGEARAVPSPVPVVVASSDGWVRAEAERDGAAVVGADALLAVLRR